MTRPSITAADREAAAASLGYKNWDDATDYRLTGEQDRQRDATVLAFAAHRENCGAWRPISEAKECGNLRLLWVDDDPLIGYTALHGWQTEDGEIIYPTHFKEIIGPEDKS